MDDKIKQLLSSKVTVRLGMELTIRGGILAFHGILCTESANYRGAISFLDDHVSVLHVGDASAFTYGFTYDEITGIQYEWGL